MFRWRRDRESDLDRELQSHLDLEAEEMRESGIPAREAFYNARCALGNTTFIKEEVRTMWGWTSLDTAIQDIRYGLRQFARTPVFAIVAVLTLALGIGANTAIFSAMNAILLRYLPVPNPQELIYLITPQRPDGAMQSNDGMTSMPLPAFEEMRKQHDVLAGLAAFVPLSFERIPVRVGAVPEELQVDMVSGNFFSTLGITAARGRLFGEPDETTHAPLAVLSYSWWTKRFSRDPSVLGQTVYVKGVAITIVGVAAPDFTGVEHSRPTDIWIPLQTNAMLKPWGNSPDSPWTLYGSPNWWCLKTIARLAPGVTPAQGVARLNPIFRHTALHGYRIGPHRNYDLRFERARGLQGLSDKYNQPLAVLMAMVGLVLVIACANVALLLVARNSARRREFGLRMAVGGNRQRLFRQLLTESLLLVTAGGVLGWFCAIAATRTLAAGWNLEFDLAPDRHVLFFTLAVSLAAALLFGLAPLRGVLRIPIGSALKSASASTSQDRTGFRTTHVVIAFQMALCLVLLIAAGLLSRTLRNLETTGLGVRTSGLLVFTINPVGLVHSEDETQRFYDGLLNRLRVLPGVESATVMANRLGSGWSNNAGGGYLVDGDAPPPQTYLRWNRAGADYFHVLGIPVLVGRDITAADNSTSPKVVVVNQVFVDRFLKDREPLGHTITMSMVTDAERLAGHKASTFTIVGVAANSKFEGVMEMPIPTAYFPVAQTPGDATLEIELRTAGSPLSLLPAVRQIVADSGPELAPLRPMTQQAQFEKSFAQERLFGRFAMFFGIVAMLLVATGLYGTLAYAVSRRTTEVGVRMALGAQRGQVLWMVLRGSLAVCLVAILLGLPAAIASVRLLRSLLYGVQPGDPLTFVAASGGILAVALAASFIPASRAASVDPVVALRHD